jgi:hypothetical protein
MAEPSKEQEWSEWNRRTAETIAKTQAASLEASRAFFEAWQKAIPQVQPVTANGNGAAHAPFQAAGDAWMRAVAEAGRRTQEAFAAGKTLGPDDFVDIWTRVASEVGTSIVEDPLFAQMTGQSVNANMQMREELRNQRDARLKELGVASASDVSEVGRRLVELERRIHELTLLVRGDAPSVPTPVKGGEGAKPTTKKGGKKEA